VFNKIFAELARGGKPERIMIDASAMVEAARSSCSLSEGQMSDYKGAALMLPALPKARELLADKGYDADWFRAALAKRGVAACIPSKSNRKIAIPYDAVLYKQRHKIENMFGRLKDWRRIHTR
jgi:transposase